VATDIVIPRLRAAMGPVTLTAWAVAPGARVRAGEILFRMRDGHTEHAVKAPEAGIVTALVPAGSVVEPGTVLGRLGPAVPWRATVEVRVDRLRALARDLGVDPAVVAVRAVARAASAVSPSAAQGHLVLSRPDLVPDVAVAIAEAASADWSVLARHLDRPPGPATGTPATVRLVWAAHLGVDGLEPVGLPGDPVVLTLGRFRRRPTGRTGKGRRRRRVATLTAVAGHDDAPALPEVARLLTAAADELARPDRGHDPMVNDG
jgi:pyruvate/2-oxoglutarate dehydrogenase complex dihydrolipoamide acyltransferase (E2) component